MADNEINNGDVASSGLPDSPLGNPLDSAQTPDIELGSDKLDLDAMSTPQMAMQEGDSSLQTGGDGLGGLGGAIGDSTGADNMMGAGNISNGLPAVDPAKIQSIKVRVQAVLGSISLSVAELSKIKEGDTIALDRKIGDPVDIVANGQIIAQGQIVVTEGSPPGFAIRITELIDQV